jgi:hypothetical protein
MGRGQIPAFQQFGEERGPSAQFIDSIHEW